MFEDGVPPERDGPGSIREEISAAIDEYFEALETYKALQAEANRAKRNADNLLARVNALKREASSGQMRIDY